VKDSFNAKLIQLYETSRVRHGFMVVGASGCGKTTIYNTLTKALSAVPGEPQYEITRLNPKAITGRQMYGCMNNLGEWEEGIFSQIWKRKNAKSEKKFNWIQADGPVDAIWIENLNTVLDDNKILTLANGERLPMSDLCKMTFEVENLNNASPATVSRNGIIYVSPNELGWEPLVYTWAVDKEKEKMTGVNWKWIFTGDKNKDPKNWNLLSKYVEKYFNNPKRKMFEWIAKNL
jgi:dynein heavy chain